MIRSLELNLASRPFRNNTPVWLGHALLGLGVVGFTAWNTMTFLETGRRVEELRNSVGSIENRSREIEVRERRVQTEIPKHDIKYLTTQTLRANDVIQRKALSWTRLFNLLEKVQPYEVKMVSIRPVFGLGGSGGSAVVPARVAHTYIPVAVEGTARDLTAFLEFERSLIGDPHFDRVEPERSTHAKDGEILFQLSFFYDPEGRARKAESVDAEAETGGGEEEEPKQTPPPAEDQLE